MKVGRRPNDDLLYRWKIKPGKEQQFESNWAIFTKAILDACDRGSRLHLAEKEVGN